MGGERLIFRCRQRIRISDYAIWMAPVICVLLLNAFLLPTACFLAVGAIAILWHCFLALTAPVTVEVTESRLTAFHGLRALSWRANLTEIEDVQVHRLRLRELFWPSRGTGAVLVRLFNGEEVILGCDEPETLVRVLRERIAEVEDASARKSTAGEEGG